jgi:hypothetical protein
METGDYNRTTNDEQQDARRNRRIDYRFLVPSRDAGGLFFFCTEIISIWLLLFKQLLVKVEKPFKNFV